MNEKSKFKETKYFAKLYKRAGCFGHMCGSQLSNTVDSFLK